MVSSTPKSCLPPPVLLGAWCAAIFEHLRSSGVSDVVISPGSRSTPLTVVALRSESFRCHSIIDERSAAYFALGLVRARQAPVALVCTSGTAGAHYLPALIEASYDGLPLVVLSADRPEELQNCGAPQTIAQGNLFGDFVRGRLPLTTPTETLDAFQHLGASLRALLSLCVGDRPGPVHVNVPLRKPLEPAPPQPGTEQAQVHALGEASTQTALQVPARQEISVSQLLEARSSARRPLLVSGPLPPADEGHFRACATLLRAPTLEEFGPAAAAGLDFVGGLMQEETAPDLIVHFGPPAVSSSWSRYIESYRGRYLVYSGSEFRDPSRRAEAVVKAPLSYVSAALNQAATALGGLSESPDFIASARTLAFENVRRALSSRKTNGLLNEPRAVATILSSCRTSDNLILGNSLPLRLASWVWSAQPALPRPYTARGVNGIDGMIAWSLGVAEATRRPTIALLGDVTAAHDIGSLQLLTHRKLQLTLVILDNRGGHIFDHLPLRDAVTEAEMRFWTTPPQLDLSAISTAFGLHCTRVTTEEELTSTINGARHSEVPQVIVVPTDPATTTEFLTAVREGHRL